MTTPTPTPSKAKTWVALIGTVLTILVPLATQLATSLPPQYAAVIGGIIGVLTLTGIYHAPYVPPGAVMVSVPPPPAPPSGGYKSTWK